ncbi:prepilin-type N-terminal cleavage/methylation domain-containing protein [Pararhodobacter sp. SW119]|uniref:pilus assembly FimT family protein n=1 Tax=Pararhodobacter sp. SW119 TaxID=2780075 RepID=UPI001ADF51AE|nr:prepilin-type N-terminal cleavage/methylation domain-containing protein [Pararhodobacter sp. SW119]
MTDYRAGFSLIELLVVTTIISVLSLGLVLGAGVGGVMERSRVDGVRRSARALEGAVSLARDQALLGRRLHALAPNPDGWEILQLENGEWQGVRAATSRRELVWRVDGKLVRRLQDPAQENWAPLILFLEDGRVTPFEVVFQAPEGVIQCETDGWEAFQCQIR